MRQHHDTYFHHFLDKVGLVMAVVLMLAGCGGQNGQNGESIGSPSGSGGRIVEPENPVQYATAFTDLDIPGDAYLISNF